MTDAVPAPTIQTVRMIRSALAGARAIANGDAHPEEPAQQMSALLTHAADAISSIVGRMEAGEAPADDFERSFSGEGAKVTTSFGTFGGRGALLMLFKTVMGHGKLADPEVFGEISLLLGDLGLGDLVRDIEAFDMAPRIEAFDMVDDEEEEANDDGHADRQAVMNRLLQAAAENGVVLDEMKAGAIVDRCAELAHHASAPTSPD